MVSSDERSGLAKAMESLESLDYPGRRKPVNRTPRKGTIETPVWDAKPLTYQVDGEEREFFVIGHLATALGYSVQAIRLWETQGLLPKSPYRSPRTTAPVAGGRSNKGKRLWTREQIDCILRLAKKHRVILRVGNSKVRKPPTRAFATEVAQEFQRLLG